MRLLGRIAPGSALEPNRRTSCPSRGCTFPAPSTHEQVRFSTTSRGTASLPIRLQRSVQLLMRAADYDLSSGPGTGEDPASRATRPTAGGFISVHVCSESAAHDREGRRAQRRSKVVCSSRTSLTRPDASPKPASVVADACHGRFTRTPKRTATRRLDHVTGEHGRHQDLYDTVTLAAHYIPLSCSAERSAAATPKQERRSSAAGS